VGGVVALGERGLALVLGGDRPDLDLHQPLVDVAVAAGELRTRQARRDPLHIGDDLPHGVDGMGHLE